MLRVSSTGPKVAQGTKCKKVWILNAYVFSEDYLGRFPSLMAFLSTSSPMLATASGHTEKGSDEDKCRLVMQFALHESPFMPRLIM